MTELSFNQKAQLENAFFITLLYTTGEDGERYYGYLAIKAVDLPKVETAQKRGHFRFEELGIVLAWGKGEPTDEVKARMLEEYAVDESGSSGMVSF